MESVEVVVHLVSAQRHHDMLVGLPAEQGWVWQVQGEVEGDQLARGDRPRRSGDPLGRDQIDRPELVAGAVHLPGMAQVQARNLRQLVEGR